MQKLKRMGFTLIELMVVVAIIGILMAAGIVAFSNAQKNARDSRRRADIDAISKALEQYYASNNAYPASPSAINAYFPSNAAPTDPQTGSAYTLTQTTTTYCACALLENTGRGNATTAGSGGTCAYGTGASANYFCASQRQ